MKLGHISKAEESSGVAAQGQSQPTHRILLVDDDRDVRTLNAEVLIRAGYHVDTAENGISGWNALQTNRYDALITDNTMPGVTGLDLIKKLRSEEHDIVGYPGVRNSAGGGIEPVPVAAS